MSYPLLETGVGWRVWWCSWGKMHTHAQRLCSSFAAVVGTVGWDEHWVWVHANRATDVGSLISWVQIYGYLFIHFLVLSIQVANLMVELRWILCMIWVNANHARILFQPYPLFLSFPIWEKSISWKRLDVVVPWICPYGNSFRYFLKSIM